MKNVSMILTLVLSTVLVACSGGGGGGGGGNPGGGGGGGGGPTGSATLLFGNAATYCAGYTINDSTECSDVSGTWITDPSTLSLSGSCNKDGSVLNSMDWDSVSCSNGTLVPLCNVSGQSFGLLVSVSEETKDVCSSVGGSVATSCKLTTSTSCSSDGGTWTSRAPFCSGATLNAAKCVTYGGHIEMSITSGIVESSIVSGTNYVDVSTSGVWGTQPLNDGTPTTLNPLKLNASMAISRNSTNIWATIVSMPVVTGFSVDASATSGSLTITSPIGETENGLDKLFIYSVNSINNQN